MEERGEHKEYIERSGLRKPSLDESGYNLRFSPYLRHRAERGR
jgi:hypothetical protein